MSGHEEAARQACDLAIASEPNKTGGKMRQFDLKRQDSPVRQVPSRKKQHDIKLVGKAAENDSKQNAESF